MEKAGVKAILYTTSVTSKWEEPPCNDLPELVNSIRNLKKSVNDYLTNLVNKDKGFADKSKKDENSDDNEEEEEEEEEDIDDTISGFIKEAALNEEVKVKSKRKVHAGAKLSEAKKKKL